MALRGNPNRALIDRLRKEGFEETQISTSDSGFSTFSQNAANATVLNPIWIYDVGNNMELALLENALLQAKLLDSGGNDLPRDTTLGIYKRWKLEKQVGFKIADLIYSAYVGVSLADQQNNDKNVGYQIVFKPRLAPEGFIHVAAGWELVVLLSGTATQFVVANSRIELDCMKRPVTG